MSRKAKARFSAQIDGVNKELFSVRELKNGDLLLVSAYAKFWGSADGKKVAFIEQHYSVHRTKNGEATTITQKTRLSDGKVHSNLAYIQRTRDHLLWPIYARRVPILEASSHLLVPRPKDETIDIGAYNTVTANFLYSVFVSKPNIDVTAIISPEAIFKLIKFRYFQIIVLAGYLNVPSMEDGDVVGWGTSSTVTDGVRDSDHIQLTVTSVPLEHLTTIHLMLMQELRARMLKRVASQIKEGTREFDLVSRMSSIISNLPLLQLGQ